MEASKVSNLLFQQLNFRGERQKVIASNIANINTPGYKTKELSFEDELTKARNKKELQLKVTHKNHIASELNQNNKSNLKVYEVQGLQEQNDGNNVNLDQQMSEMSKNSVMFNAIQSSIKKDFAWMKEIIVASSKN
jgi:flagellar basal-body rod protein FlgB